MSLLTTLIIRNSHNLAGMYFIFLKKRLRPNLNVFNAKFGSELKYRESSYQLGQVFSAFL